MALTLIRTIPRLTGEPCAGEPHARFGWMEVRHNRTFLLPIAHARDKTLHRLARLDRSLSTDVTEGFSS